MTETPNATSAEPSGLELFVRDYVEAVGGVWDEIEPQVYDLLLPAETSAADAPERALRVAFDPEALPEHPRAQLASFGTPLVERLLAMAVDRGRHGELHLLGLNLDPFNLQSRLARGLTLADDLELQVGRLRALEFPLAIYWFEATFISDQKEQEIVPVAVDLHSGREVRHIERLLDPARLSDKPAVVLPAATCIEPADAYRLAREQVLRTLTGLANLRSRELQERLKKQAARMTHYYDDLLRELDDDVHRARNRDTDAAKFTNRRDALERERHTRIAELHHKNALTVELELLNFLVVRQPKLTAAATVTDKDGAASKIELIWDPLVEAVEPVACPICRHPTFELIPRRRGELACPTCAKAAPATVTGQRGALRGRPTSRHPK